MSKNQLTIVFFSVIILTKLVSQDSEMQGVYRFNEQTQTYEYVRSTNYQINTNTQDQNQNNNNQQQNQQYSDYQNNSNQQNYNNQQQNNSNQQNNNSNQQNYNNQNNNYPSGNVNYLDDRGNQYYQNNQTYQDYKPTVKSSESNEPFGKICKNCTRFRLFGGPTFTKFFDNKYFPGNDVFVNFVGGGEFNFRAGERMYYVLGLDYTNLGIKKDLTDENRDFSMRVKYHFLELPIGMGINLGNKQPKGIFMNFSIVNRITVATESSSLYTKESIIVQDNKYENEVDFYNFGLKYEMGYKTKLYDDLYTSFSYVIKPMFINLLNENRQQATLDLGAMLSIYF